MLVYWASSSCQALYMHFPGSSPTQSTVGLGSKETEAHCDCDLPHLLQGRTKTMRPDPNPPPSDFKGHTHALSSKLSSEVGENSKKPRSVTQIAILLHIRQCRRMSHSTILSSTASPASTPNRGIFETAEHSRQPHKDPSSSSWPFPLTGFLSRESANLN